MGAGSGSRKAPFSTGATTTTSTTFPLASRTTTNGQLFPPPAGNNYRLTDSDRINYPLTLLFSNAATQGGDRRVREATRGARREAHESPLREPRARRRLPPECVRGRRHRRLPEGQFLSQMPGAQLDARPLVALGPRWHDTPPPRRPRPGPPGPEGWKVDHGEARPPRIHCQHRGSDSGDLILLLSYGWMRIVHESEPIDCGRNLQFIVIFQMLSKRTKILRFLNCCVFCPLKYISFC